MRRPPGGKGEYFRQQLSVVNTGSAVWQSVTNAQSGQTSVTGNLFVPKTPELFAYDADGNLTNDGRWSYTWDAENRLVRMTNNTAVGPQQLITFQYDWKGRRIHKQVSANATMTNNVTFVYDGWNPVAQLNATNNNVVQSYLWGLDLSGSMQGAGGVRGPYNQLWQRFISEKGQRIKSDPFFMIGFGFGLLDQLGFGDLMIK
ncbi:MAG: RHS repeat domain-containing protein [Verrucomicrobiota bacterium]|jgi:YD repeat-containing protein